MHYLRIGNHFARLSAALFAVDRGELEKAIVTLREARSARKCVWIVGNGGSAATASHFANDLTKMCGIKAFSIPSMMPTVTAFGNDNGWEHMFEHTMDVYLEADDVVVAISCGGKSMNVLKAASQVKNLVILTGNDLLSPITEKQSVAFFHVQDSDITIQEDVHLAICHAIAKALVE